MNDAMNGAMKRFAPAKINLALHVTGRRADGYHRLDSIVCFADLGDWVTLTPAPAIALGVTGPMAAGVPDDNRNLAWRAAAMFDPNIGVDIHLEKHLPAAAGIGGGSSDAAAVLRGVSDMWQRPLPNRADILALGADIPVCLRAGACHMAGIGEDIKDIPTLPPLYAVLVTPNIAVPTGVVFNGLTCANTAPLPPLRWSGFADFIAWLQITRNDLEPPACAYAPAIRQAISRLQGQPHCALARMSGSGATCFGLFEKRDHAQTAARALAATYPDWWVQAAMLN
jgi:4-diphosphocytidyl-2-C-methyl-D-erythritol kinase